MNEGTRLQTLVSSIAPCTLTALHHLTGFRNNHLLVICDAALDSVAAVESLRAALLQVGLRPDTPVLCLLRDPSHLAQAQAKAAGATVTLSRQAPPDVLRSTIQSLLRTRPEPTDAVSDREILETGCKTVGAALFDIFGQRTGQPLVSAASLERASDVLVEAIGQAGVKAWLDVVLTYDDLTYQHCMTVAGLTAAFGLELGLQPRSQNLLSQAALLHDIGKAQIPREILNKAGSLTHPETVLMRSHPVRGYAMLAGKRELHIGILDVVRHHHEYLDGSGYPDGLKGEQVSRMVRIVTICDIYAALIEHRTYKKPMASKEALAYLDTLGDRLDRPLVRAFRNVVRES